MLKFDVIIANPPYQDVVGGGSFTELAKPLYNEFLDVSMQLHCVHILFLIPSRWLSGGNSVLDDMRTRVVTSKHIRSIKHYSLSTDLFESVEVPGGVQYMHIDMTKSINEVEFTNVSLNRETMEMEVTTLQRPLDKYVYADGRNCKQVMVLIDNKASIIIRKVYDYVKSRGNIFMKDTTLSSTTFGLATNFDDSAEQTKDKWVKVIKSHKEYTYTNESNITNNSQYLDKYKVFVSRLSYDRGGLNNCKQLFVTSRPFIAGKGVACTASYLVVATFDTEEEAINCANYLKLRFTRFLIQATISSIHVAPRNLMFVPIEDFRFSIEEQSLYRKYGVTDAEKEYINSLVRDYG